MTYKPGLSAEHQPFTSPGRLMSGASFRSTSHFPRQKSDSASPLLDYLASGGLGCAGTAGVVGTTGTCGAAGDGASGMIGPGGASSTIERGARPALLNTTRKMLVRKNSAASIAVVRVNRLAVERPVIKPDMPPPPMPRAPPSLFCNSTTPTSVNAIRTWTTNS